MPVTPGNILSRHFGLLLIQLCLMPENLRRFLLVIANGNASAMTPTISRSAL
jgi:hypothetical protein